MKKLIEKDKLKRATILELEKRAKVLKSLFQNFNLPILIRWNSFLKLKKIGCQIKKVSISARCVESVNKKRFSKQTNFSRTC